MQNLKKIKMIHRFNKYAVITLLLLRISGYSQIQDNNQDLLQGKTLTSFDFRSNELVGSIYVNEEFLLAKLSNREDQYLMRYNAYQDEMEFKKGDKIFNLSKNLNYLINFQGINKTYQVYNYIENKESVPGFFVVLYNGDNISLLTKEKIKFYEEVKAKTGYDKYKPPTMRRLDDKFYIGYKKSVAKELPRKEKDILDLFGSKYAKIESYAKTNKLGFKKEEDLIQLFMYYDSLK